MIRFRIYSRKNKEFFIKNFEDLHEAINNNVKLIEQNYHTTLNVINATDEEKKIIANNIIHSVNHKVNYFKINSDKTLTKE
jgi:2'-5' RNA ligase